MPRVKGYLTKENYVRFWLLSGVKQTSGVKTLKTLAKRIGMPQSTFDRRMAHPETFKLSEIWAIEGVFGRKLFGKEVQDDAERTTG